jgi:hydroxymethylbilane synthase
MVAARLRDVRSGVNVTIRTIETGGDRVSKWSEVRDETGIFVKEIEDALLNGEVDMAVHSVKDMPASQPPGLVLASVPDREDPRDVLVSRNGATFENLASGAVIGTSSIRRKAQLLYQRPDITVVDLRGNVDTRLKKLDENHMAGTVIAAAGLVRLGLSAKISEYLPLQWMLPAPCQGAVGIEVRADDSASLDIAESINDRDAFMRVEAERAFMRYFGAGCRIPVSALAEISSGRIHMECVATEPHGRSSVRVMGEAPVEQSAALGERLARKLLDAGGRQLAGGTGENK